MYFTTTQVIELPLMNPELFQRVGITPPKGCLLYGPPGDCYHCPFLLSFSFSLSLPTPSFPLSSILPSLPLTPSPSSPHTLTFLPPSYHLSSLPLITSSLPLPPPLSLPLSSLHHRHRQDTPSSCSC